VTDQERIRQIVADLGLGPTDPYVINGSGSMVMHGITADDRGRPMGDLDVFVATRHWFEMLDAGYHDQRWAVWTTDPSDPMRRSDPPYLDGIMYDLPVNVFHGWRQRMVGNFNVAFYLANPVIIDGVRCVP
jgi:hypothetical protein